MSSGKRIRAVIASALAGALAFGCIVLVPGVANAANPVAISVLDASTQSAVRGAFVSVIAITPADSNGDGLLDVDAGSAVVAGITDSAGLYSPTKTDQSPLDDAKYGLVVSASGYQSASAFVTVSGSSGTATVKLSPGANNLSSLGAYGGNFTTVAADGRSGVFYAATSTVPSIYRTTDFGGSWAPVNLNRDEPVEPAGNDGIQGLSAFGTAANLVTSGYPGEVAVTVGNTEWYSRDFGNNWHSFALPQANPLSISWSHAHAPDTSDHVSVMLFSYSNTTDLFYAFMPSAGEGNAVSLAGKAEPRIDIKTMSGLDSLKESASDLVTAAAGSTSDYIAVQQGSLGTKLYEVAPGQNAISRVGANPTLIADLTRNTSNGTSNPGTNDALFFGGQSNVDGIPSSLVVYDKTVNNDSVTATVAVASLYPDANGVDAWSTATSMWTDSPGGGFVASNASIGDKSPGSNAPSCSSDATPIAGFIAPMFAGVGNADIWGNAATTAMVGACVIVQVPEASTISGTAVPAGAVLVLNAPGVSTLSSAAFDAGFDFGQSDEVSITAEPSHGLAKSATWLTGGADGSVMNVDNAYGFRPLLPAADNTADGFIQNQATPGTDTTSGGYSVRGINASSVSAIAFDPTDPSAHLVALEGAGGNRTLMSVDSGASYFTVGGGASATTWWVDANGQHWIAAGPSGNASTLLAVRQFSQDDLSNAQFDVSQSGLDPDDPNYLGTRLSLSAAFSDFGAGQFKVSGLQAANVQALQGIAKTNLLLMAAGNDISSSLALVALTGDSGAESLGAVKYFTNAGATSGSLSVPTFSGQAITSIQYCPTGSAPSVSDKAFVSLADQTGSSTGGIRVLSNLTSGSPVVSTPAATGLSLGASDNVRDLKVDCDSGIIALVARSANGAASPSSPLIFVSNNAGAAFKAVTKNAGQSLSSTLNDLERVAVKSDSAAGTFDLVFMDLVGDVVTGQAKLTDFGKSGITVALRSANDPLNQVATTFGGEIGGSLAYSPSDSFVSNYISLTGVLATPSATPQRLVLGSGSGLFSVNTGASKLIASKQTDSISVTAKIGAASPASWTGAITLPQDKTGLIAATAASGLPVSMTTSSPCTIADGTLSSNASSGTCIVRFTTAGDNAYAPASATRTVTLAAGTPKMDDSVIVTYRLGNDPATTWTGSGLTLKNGTSATVSVTAASGLTVSVALQSGSCSFTNSVLTANSASGSCLLSLSTNGNSFYNPVSSSRTAKLTNRPDTLAVSIAVGASPRADGATAASWNSGQPAQARFGQVAAVVASAASKTTVQIASSANCSFAAGVLTPNTGTGTCLVTFTTAASGGWDAISETRTLNLSLAPDALDVKLTDANGQRVWDSGDASLVYGAKAIITATASSGAATSIAIAGPCSLAGNSITANSGVGNCDLTIGTQASSKFAAATVTRRFVLAKATDAISVTQTPTGGQASNWTEVQTLQLEYGKSITVASTSLSGQVVNTSVSGSCSLAAGKVLATSGTGTCSITSSTVGNLNYGATSTTRGLTLTLAPDSIAATLAIGGGSAVAWTTNQPKLRIDQTATISATSASQKIVTLVASGACTIANSVIAATATAGTCTISATTSADGKYSPVANSWTLALAPKLAIPDTLAVTYKLLKLGSTTWSSSSVLPVSGLTATYGDQLKIVATSLSGTVADLAASGSCKLSDATVTVTKGSGDCSISAALADSDGFTGTTQNFSVGASPAAIAAPAISKMKVGSKQLLATGIKVLAKTAAYKYSIAQASAAFCTISNGHLIAKKKGNCSVIVTSAGVAGYLEGLKTTIVVKVG